MAGHPAGNLLITAGIGLVLIGVAISLGAGKLFGFLGKLPGDIRIENEHSTVYIPIASCLLVSVVLSLALLLLSKIR